MIFTSFTYLYFFLLVLIAYWLIANKSIQNVILLVASYVFYGWVHPWFCFLIAFSTLVDYFCGVGMKNNPERRKLLLITSVISNLGLLGFFKYFNFFSDSIHQVLTSIGLGLDPFTLSILLPVGISFYTFQSLSYTIDIYRGKLEARTNPIDFAVFVSCFPQLVAGPIERATHFLPQIESKRKFNWNFIEEAIPLFIRGYLKKLVIADNIAMYVDQVFMYHNPPFMLLLAGTLAFTLQIYADFSAYTDIARGSAKLLGFNLVRNFNLPYIAISPSDFWRRWHMSFSTWIRDYLYFSLGGSRVKNTFHFAIVLIVTLGLSGLWHGAAWNFVLWGLFHAVLVFIYHKLGMGGSWQPKGIPKVIFSWLIMLGFTVFGWLLFRAPTMEWLTDSLSNLSLSADSKIKAMSLEIIIYILLYSIPLFMFTFLDKVIPERKWAHYIVYGISLAIIMLFFSEQGQDFIYFKF